MKRRDFINGTLMVAGASMFPGCTNNTFSDKFNSLYYPPSLTGLRGSHPGSNTHAHDRAWSKKSDWGPTNKLKEIYDLVVVGGGISGLSAAYFYQQKYGKDKKVLILDNHDDFGGHAKRNEHTIDGKTLISNGGSQSIVDPKLGNKVVHDLLKDIGVEIERFNTAYDRDFYKRNNLGSVTYFNKKIFGEDKVVRHPYCNYPNYIEGLMAGKLSNEDAAQEAPLSKKGKKQLLKVLNGGLHKINVPKNKLNDYIRSHSYFDYLKDTLGVDDPGILRMARHSALDWAVSGTDLMTIETAKSCGALGFIPKTVYDEDNPYIYHFPDGNASIARALVKKMIPGVAEGKNAEELVLSKFKYAELDKFSNTVRIRLNSTVVNVRHGSDPKNSSEIFVKYINNNKSHMIKAKSVVMACYNMMIPHIVSDLPEEQASALRLQSKSPLQYSSVSLKNWRAMKEMEIGMAMSPGNMHQAIFMDFPVSMGGYEYTKTPDDPCIIQMISCPYGETVGAPRIEQYREARYRMLGLQFSDYEEEIRSHLSGMLPKKLFDFDKDVESITVNRWAHGYTVSGPKNSTKIGRQPFGQITIANCDSAGSADAKAAINMASRAVNELS
ncbi:MAG TPA: NAD(P)/FAD-dependent oxidoreductase [Flavobacteriaceae bacterium]|nr:NAD(P)/FAD-dependent oxidoreductase [Flavobacteriaceae bacterium]